MRCYLLSVGLIETFSALDSPKNGEREKALFNASFFPCSCSKKRRKRQIPEFPRRQMQTPQLRSSFSPIPRFIRTGEVDSHYPSTSVLLSTPNSVCWSFPTLEISFSLVAGATFLPAALAEAGLETVNTPLVVCLVCAGEKA